MSLITVYGELFGGHYPHDSVSPVSGLKPVQTGIYYSPSLEFFVFDIAIHKQDKAAAFLSYGDMRDLCIQSGFQYVHALFEG